MEKTAKKNTGSISRSGDARLIIRDVDDIPPAFIVKRDLTNQGMQQSVIKCMSKLIHAFFVSTYRREKRFQNQMIRVINQWQVNSDMRYSMFGVLITYVIPDVSHVQKISESSSQTMKLNSGATWCPDHPSKEAKTMDAYWYLVYSWKGQWFILWFQSVLQGDSTSPSTSGCPEYLLPLRS